MKIYCGHKWKAPRIMTNTDGEEFETLPVTHICDVQGVEHEGEHICSCGAIKETT